MTSTTETSCAVHPGVRAAGPCERCGTFSCSACLNLAGVCQRCVERQVQDLPSLSGRAFWVKGGLWGMAGLHAALAGASLWLPTPKEGELTWGAAVLGLLGLTLVPLFITTIVWFCRWFHLAVRHGAARSVLLDVTPGSAVGSWFIPFVNLVRPFDITRRLLRGWGGSEARVGEWQAAWIAGNVASNVSNRVDSVPLSVLAELLLVAAAVLCISVIRHVTESAQRAP